jgi:hypothetical protein
VIGTTHLGVSAPPPQVMAAMEIIKADATTALYNGG